MFVLPMSIARSMAAMIRGADRAPACRRVAGCLRPAYHRGRRSLPRRGSALRPAPSRSRVSIRAAREVLRQPAASCPAGRTCYNLLRPLLKQTVSYRYLRGRDLIATAPAGSSGSSSTSPTSRPTSRRSRSASTSTRSSTSSSRPAPTSCSSTRSSRATSGSSRVRADRRRRRRTPPAPRQLEFDTSGFVQMELLGLDAHEDE